MSGRERKVFMAISAFLIVCIVQKLSLDRAVLRLSFSFHLQAREQMPFVSVRAIRKTSTCTSCAALAIGWEPGYAMQDLAGLG